MNNTKHTPGPWVTSEGEGNYYNEIKATSKRGKTWVIARISAAKVGHDQARANASLIAAAPDLLKELHTLHDAVAMIVGNDSPVLQSAQATIAKATGERP